MLDAKYLEIRARCYWLVLRCAPAWPAYPVDSSPASANAKFHYLKCENLQIFVCRKTAWQGVGTTVTWSSWGRAPVSAYLLPMTTVCIST